MKDFDIMSNVEILNDITEFLKTLEKGFNKLRGFLDESDDKTSDYEFWESVSLELDKASLEWDLRYAELSARIVDLVIEVSRKKLRIIQEEKEKIGGSKSGKEEVKS